MKRKLKKVLAVALSATMMCSMFALSGCGKSGDNTGSGGSNAGTGGGTAREAVEVTEPITIKLWHCSGTGANGDYIDAAVKAFNETNEYGITVETTYVGAYADSLSKVSSSIAAKEDPVLAVMGDVGIPTLANKGVLADMTAYVERDNFDIDNFLTPLQEYIHYEDQIISFPFNRSISLLYYNKTIWSEMGMEPSAELTELYQQAASISKAKSGVYGFGAHSDPFYFQEAWVRSLGSEGLTTDGGNSACSLDDGNLERVFTDWLTGIEDEYVAPISVVSAETDMIEGFYRGKIASIVASSGSLVNIMKFAEENGVDVGVSMMPAYGGTNSILGGGNLVVLGKNHSDQEISAAWEFVKFLSSDEWVAKRAMGTGYIPVTYSAAETDTMKTFWEENPEYKVAYDQAEFSKQASWSLYQSEWDTYLNQATSYVLQDRSMTPKEAVDYLKKQASIIFE